MEYKSPSPVLFLIFNRPDKTQRVFDQIKKYKPKRLFIAADGHRENKDGEKENCIKTRKIVQKVDWDCEIKTLFREKNLGCKLAVSSAIDWFFDYVNEGIILEDDCLPSQSFFSFCEELLIKFKNDEKVMQICGSNFLYGWQRNDNSYYFSRYGPIWGWASWKRAWKHYDVDMKIWPEVKQKKVYLDLCENIREALFRINIYDRVYSGDLDTWDFQWGFAKLMNSGLSVIPNRNLIENIGIGKNSTHTKQLDKVFANMAVSDVDFPLRHPEFICRDKFLDKKYLKIILRKATIKYLLWRLLSKLKLT